MRKWDGGRAVQHLRARKVLSASSVPVVYLNILAWFFQDFSNYMNSSILERRTFVMPADRLMNYIDAGDIGRAAAELMLDPSRTQPGGTYHLTNGVDCCTFRELAGLMSEAFGEQIDFEGDEKTFLRMLGDACRSYYGRQDAPEWVLDFSRWEDAFLGTLGDDPWSNMVPEGEPMITPEQLGFAPKPLRDWLAEHREAFLGKRSASLA